MVLGGSVSMSVIWLIAMVILLVVEAMVPGLISIWFAIGALAALISALFHAPVWLQLVWFFAISILTLAVAARTPIPALQNDAIDVSSFGLPLME